MNFEGLWEPQWLKGLQDGVSEGGEGVSPLRPGLKPQLQGQDALATGKHAVRKHYAVRLDAGFESRGGGAGMTSGRPLTRPRTERSRSSDFQ